MERLNIFKCNVCGNVVEVLLVGGGTLTCCKQPMERMAEQTADSSTEKHVPIMEKSENGITVKVGSVPHPMTGEHFIQWIETIEGDEVRRVFLKPGMDAMAAFCCVGDAVTLREFCNIHGLWKG